MRAELNAAAITAGVTAFIWYACGALPLQLAVTEVLALPSGSVFIVWASGAAAAIVLCLRLRQPIAITWSIPALVYLGSLAGRFSAAEIAGAILVSAFFLATLVVLGVGGRLMRWLPMPIVMGAFAGSLLEYMHRAVTATVGDAAIAGTVVLAYLAARRFASPRVPPAGAALAAGVVAVALLGFRPQEVHWALPVLAVPQFAFDPAAIAAIGVPLVVFSLGLGNAQGLGYLVAQGYRVPVDRVSRAVALASLLNALFAGAPATVARNGAALLAAPSAGPANARYWGVLISSGLVLAMACTAEPLSALVASVPRSFVVSLAGVALIASLQDALEKAFGGPLRFGAVVAFVVAATPVSVVGITSAFWALVAGVLASIAAREQGLLAAGIREQESPMAGIPKSQGRAEPKIGPSDSSDSIADRPNQSTDTDDSGTGERATVGRRRPPRPETGTDRVAQDGEVGLGGGLDQAEEGKLGITDEELEKEARKGR